MTDTLHKFLFEAEVPFSENQPPAKSPVRGEIVSLHATWRQIHDRHDYPFPVMRLLGEMAAASALLSASLKFDGTLVMQIHGDGPVRLLVVECSADLRLRATANVREGALIGDDASLGALVNSRGLGRFAITLDPKNRELGQLPYQSIVPLEGETIAEALESYMLRSEQLETRLWLAADGEHANGFLLQRLPTDDGTAETRTAERDAETWNRIVMLANTLSPGELLELEPQSLLRRLFWEETIRIFKPRACRFECTCTRERVAKMLVSLGEDEVNETLGELGNIHVNCDFCNREYVFDAVDCAQLFAASNIVDRIRSAEDQRH